MARADAALPAVPLLPSHRGLRVREQRNDVRSLFRGRVGAISGPGGHQFHPAHKPVIAPVAAFYASHDMARACSAICPGKEVSLPTQSRNPLLNP